MKKELEDNLKKELLQLNGLKNIITKTEALFIGQKEFLSRCEEVSLFWFEKIEVKLRDYPIGEAQTKYPELFRELLKLSSRNNRKSSFEKIIGGIVKSFRDDLIIPVQTSTQPKPVANGLDTLLSEIQDPTENEYLAEAVKCAKSNYKRAAIVLGWCAAIDRIHYKLVEIGLERFNDISLKMAHQTKGRFKKYNKSFSANSISDLRNIFDNDISWVLEGMGLIDINEHTRLRSCFDMRCHAAHPGNAPTTIYNLMSFFSDLNEIIFKNPTFILSAPCIWDINTNEMD